MRGTPIYKDLELGSVRFDSLREETNKRSFTGYMKIAYWDMEDYLYYLRGKPVGGIRYLSQGGSERIDPEYYHPSSMVGLLSLYATSPIEVFAFLESLQEKVSPYSFITYGQEVVAPLQLSHTDPELILSQVSSLNTYGYMIFAGQQGFGPLISLSAGKPVFVFEKGRRHTTRRIDLHIEQSEAYLSVFRTEPEFVDFLASVDSIKKVHSTTIHNLHQIKEIIKGFRNTYQLLEILFTQGLRLFMFVFNSSLVFKIFSKNGVVLQEHQPLIHNKEFVFNIYTVPIKTDLPPIEINFISLKTSVEYVQDNELSVINRFFLEDIGPVGVLVWRKVFEKMGLEPNKLPRDKLGEFIARLAEEIPDERHSKSFLEKTRRWLL